MASQMMNTILVTVLICVVVVQAEFSFREFCTGRKSGNYSHPTLCNKDNACCNKYIACIGFIDSIGAAYLMPCPAGLYYDAKNNLCDFPKNANCMASQGSTCFGAKDNAYGVFEASQDGFIKDLKITHKSGFINCAEGIQWLRSLWGCHNREIGAEILINIHITDNNNTRLFPSPVVQYHLLFGKDGYYFLPPFEGRSNHIKFSDKSPRVFVKKGQQLRLWFGEDLLNRYDITDNNGGKHCVDIMASYFK